MSQEFDLKEYEWRFYIKNDEVVGSSNKTQGDITGPPHDKFIDKILPGKLFLKYFTAIFI